MIALFSSFGALSEVVLLRTKGVGVGELEAPVSKGTAFVKFASKDSADLAIRTLDKQFIDKVRHFPRCSSGVRRCFLLFAHWIVVFVLCCCLLLLDRTPTRCCKFVTLIPATQRRPISVSSLRRCRLRLHTS